MTTKRRQIGSNRKLAAVLDVSEKTVRTYLRRADWPVRTLPPWSEADVARIRTWRGTLQEDRAKEVAADGEAQFFNLGLKFEKMLHERARRRRAEGSTVDRSLLDASFDNLARTFVAGLVELERVLPLQTPGLELAQVQRVVSDRIQSIRDQINSRLAIEHESLEQAIRATDRRKAIGRPASRR